MNKNELIKNVSMQSKLTQKDCMRFLSALQMILTESLQRGEEISISGFGKFYSRYKRERKGINPATKDYVCYPSKFIPSFKSSAIFQEKLN